MIKNRTLAFGGGSGAGWLPLATNTLGTNGVWQFTDFGMSNNPDCFYRLMQQ
jgi:hypothetical protein